MPKRVESDKQAAEPIHKTQPLQPVNQESPVLQQQTAPGVLTRRIATAPRTVRPADILALQRAGGNRAVSQLLQAKLTRGPVGNCYEQEANRVAEQVLRMPLSVSDPQVALSSQTPGRLVSGKAEGSRSKEAIQCQAKEEEELQLKPTTTIQRQDDEEEEGELQMKPLATTITPIAQRQELEEEEEKELQLKPTTTIQRQDEKEEEEIQAKPEIVNRDGSFEASGDVESRLAAQKGHGNPLSDETRAFMEPRFGADFSGVRVHTGSEASQMTKEVKAQAFTHGQDIYFGAGKYDPGSSGGQRLLAHELTHTIQQGVSPPVQRDRGQAQPPVATTIVAARPDVVQRSEDEKMLEFKTWKKKSFSFTRKRKELQAIDEAVKDYNKIKESKKNRAKRDEALIVALERIVALADHFADQMQARKKKDRATRRLANAASKKADELRDERGKAFKKEEVQRQRVEEVVPKFYEIKKKLKKKEIDEQAAAEEIFDKFTAYEGFTYTTEASRKTLKQGLFMGACQDFAQALADLFVDVGIDAKADCLPQSNFITKKAEKFIDRECPGNLKMKGQGYDQVKRFYFPVHAITKTSKVGDFDPTAGVMGDEAVDPDLTGFKKMENNKKTEYGLKETESADFIEKPDGLVVVKQLDEIAPTLGAGCEMQWVPKKSKKKSKV